MVQWRVHVGLEVCLAQAFHGRHGGRRMDVIQKCRRTGEALVPNELLRIQAAVRLAERDVPLSRNLSKRVIEGHRATPSYRFPRRPCSRSMASKSALKLPAPKLLAP